MEKTLSLHFLLLGTIACPTPPKGFVINGTVEDANLDGKTIYLWDYDKDTRIDSAVIAEGAFSFSGLLENPALLRLELQPSLFAYILTENGNTISVVMGDPSIIDDNGGINSKSRLIDSTLNTIFTPYEQKQKELEEQGITGDAMLVELSPMIKELFSQYKEASIRYMDENKDNLIGASLLLNIVDEIESLEKFDSICSVITYSKYFKTIASYREKLEGAQRTQPGNMFIDFKGTAVDGSEIALSEFVGKGKYVLVDFWASWCGPCKGEIPNLKELHEKYGNKNFMVLGVNVWDKKDAFEKAIKEEGMVWSHIYASQDKSATELYGIDGIPQIMLFAPDGTIVERNLRGEEMKAKVAELFKK